MRVLESEICIVLIDIAEESLRWPVLLSDSQELLSTTKELLGQSGSSDEKKGCAFSRMRLNRP